MSEEEIKQTLTKGVLLATKAVLSIDEAALYCGVSKSYIYKKTMARQIPHFKKGSKCYFNRRELENWLQENRVLTQTQLDEEAKNYSRKDVRK